MDCDTIISILGYALLSRFSSQDEQSRGFKPASTKTKISNKKFEKQTDLAFRRFEILDKLWLEEANAACHIVTS